MTDVRDPTRKLDERQKHLEDLEIDKFGRVMSSNPPLGHVPGGSSQYLPFEHETLQSYTRRVRDAVEEMLDISYRQHIDTPRGGWYTHKRNPPTCWICTQGNILLILHNSLVDLSQLLDAEKYSYEYTGSNDYRLFLTKSK